MYKFQCMRQFTYSGEPVRQLRLRAKKHISQSPPNSESITGEARDDDGLKQRKKNRYNQSERLPNSSIGQYLRPTGARVDST